MALAIMEGVDLVVPCNQITEVIPATIHLPKWIWSYPAMYRALSRKGKTYFYELNKEAMDKSDNYAKRLMTAEAETGLSKKEVASLTSNLIGGECSDYVEAQFFNGH